MKGLVGGPLLVGGLGPGPPASPLKSDPDTVYICHCAARVIAAERAVAGILTDVECRCPFM